jgi:D-xylose transport system substrate-binding protein
VIAYDRPIPDKPADYYVSFDNEAIGKSIAQSLVEHLKETKAEGRVCSRSTGRRPTPPPG